MYSKSVSHALLTPSSRYPLVLIARGHLLNSMGITVRGSTASTKGKGRVELLPEEALYLLERGSLQIWIGREAETEEDVRRSIGQWKDEEYGVGGAIEMGVMEGFGMFIGKEGLTWERYQVSCASYEPGAGLTDVGLRVSTTAGIYRAKGKTLSSSSFHRLGLISIAKTGQSRRRKSSPFQDVVDEHTSVDYQHAQEPRKACLWFS